MAEERVEIPKIRIERTIVEKEVPDETGNGAHPEFTPEIQKLIDDQVKEKNKVFADQLMDTTRKNFQAAVRDIENRMKPPTHEDIQKILNQEYLTFQIQLPVNGENRNFLLKEMPQILEKKFYKKIKENLVPMAVSFQSLNMNMLDGGDIRQKLERMVDMVEPMLDIISECAAISLNPRDEDKVITKEWVIENLSSMRIISIVNAQAQCNRMRDFFSLLSQGMRSLT